MKDSEKIMKKYPERIPIIVKKKEKSDIPDIDKKKYLVPKDMLINQFIFIIRKRIKVTPEKAIFLTINNVMPSSTSSFAELYEEHKNQNGFLDIIYSSENTFG